MRSGNGRHRRPRQVPALVVTAGVTGSALALPLLAATSATAADTSTWDKVAECESGGTWSANFGSGAYGGLQFTQEQWQGAGGLDFAERPDLASRAQQIAVGERVLASQGPQAWPLCAASAGLSQQGPAAEVDPGGSGPVKPSPSRPDDVVPPAGKGAPAKDFGAPTPKPSPSGTPSFVIPDGPLAPSSGLPVMPAPDFPPTVDPSAPVSPEVPGGESTAPVDPTTPAPSPDPTAPTAPSTSPSGPSGPKDPATPGASADPTAPAPSADPSAPAEGGGKHRGTPAVEAPGTPDAASDPVYTVKAGDSLTGIADAKGLKGGWNALYQANEQVIGGDADLIKPGQNLDLSKK
ncbi:transglycosylase family protein [Streptomyces sp. NBC_01408]|uniref:LysM peptidoglycan-binding domain-containing protein n=1 Tax=Streptomyces sp. NBC_01408 TaxID=2903855 RepID=UPI0022575922|nr:transglycosylase family protein [Streptomyces sp. NBC_01408]MCX4692960.1 transglycosylase family protein [Streptomyces sp. NBC_01408]